MSDEKTFTRADIQAWINSLGEKESAMLAHAIGEAEFRAACEAMRDAAENVAGLARQFAAEDRKTRSKVAREIVGLLLTVHRDMVDAARAFSNEKPVHLQ